jgi:hypothetical protein
MFHLQAKKVKNLIPNSNLTTIENGPMYLSRAMPQEFAQAILSFLSLADG